MPAITLAQNIVNALKALPPSDQYNAGTGPTMNTIIAGELTKYILANCKVIVTYVGVTPSGSPEGIGGPNPIAGAVAPSVPGPATTWVDTWGKNLSTGFTTLPGVVKPLAPHISLAVPNNQLSTFVPVGACDGVHGAPDPCLDWWTRFSEGVFKMINTQVSSPYPASLAGTGTATVTKLELI